MLVAVAAATAFAAAATIRGIRRLRAHIVLRRRLQGGQPVLADNTLVTMTGVVRAIGEPLRAPLSGKRCVLHHSTARVATVRGRRRVALDAYSQCEMVEFVLDTRDGEVIVAGQTADVTFRPSPLIPRRLDREGAFLKAIGLTVDARSVSCDEIVIEPGMKVAVHGVAHYERSATATDESGFRDAPAVVRLVGHPRHPLTIGPAA
jgi:hypothetical protein